eukprot:4927190-Prorocentrum_lima.AAC.1
MDQQSPPPDQGQGPVHGHVPQQVPPQGQSAPIPGLRQQVPLQGQFHGFFGPGQAGHQGHDQGIITWAKSGPPQ